MTAKQIASTAMRAAQTGLISTMIFQLAIGSTFAAGQTDTPHHVTTPRPRRSSMSSSSLVKTVASITSSPPTYRRMARQSGIFFPREL